MPCKFWNGEGATNLLKLTAECLDGGDAGKANTGKGNLVYVQVTANAAIPSQLLWNINDLLYVQWQQLLLEIVLTISLSQCWSKQPVQGRHPARCYFLCCAQLSAEGPAISAAIRRFIFFFFFFISHWCLAAAALEYGASKEGERCTVFMSSSAPGPACENTDALPV